MHGAWYQHFLSGFQQNLNIVCMWINTFMYCGFNTLWTKHAHLEIFLTIEAYLRWFFAGLDFDVEVVA